MQWNETGLRPLVQCVKIIDIIISVFLSTPKFGKTIKKKSTWCTQIYFNTQAKEGTFVIY